MAQNTKDIEVSILGWTDAVDSKGLPCWQLSMLQMYECVGGRVAEGKMSLYSNGSNDSAKFITNKTTGTIVITDKKPGGLRYTVPFYIVDREHLKNILSVKFVCISDYKFLTEKVSIKYTEGIRSTIEATFPGKVDIQVDPGISDVMPLYQANETNYEFNKRLSYAYKLRSVFAYGWNGYFIKDRDTEPVQLLNSDTTFFNIQAPSLKFDAAINQGAVNAWRYTEEEDKDFVLKTDYSEYEPSNLCSVTSYGDYGIVHRENEYHMINWYENTTFIGLGGYSRMTVKGTDIPTWKLGDTIYYKLSGKKGSIPYSKYLVASNEIFYTVSAGDSYKVVDSNGMSFSWTTKLYGLDTGNWSNEETDGDLEKEK